MAYGNGSTNYDRAAATQSIPNAMVGGVVGSAPQRQSEVSGRFDDLTRQTETLHQHITDLEQRLSAVLGPAPPSAESANVPIMQTQLASGLADQAARVRLACERLASITSRLEL